MMFMLIFNDYSTSYVMFATAIIREKASQVKKYSDLYNITMNHLDATHVINTAHDHFRVQSK